MPACFTALGALRVENSYLIELAPPNKSAAEPEIDIVAIYGLLADPYSDWGRRQDIVASRFLSKMQKVFTALTIGRKREEVMFTTDTIIEACGPFLDLINGNLQCAHFITKGYLSSTRGKTANSDLSQFYVGFDTTN